MELGFLAIDDFDLVGRRVFLRVDFNSPIDPATGRILDDLRIRASVETLDALKSAKVILGSHQGRPGSYDFTSLSEHAKVLSKYVKQEVKFVEDVIGPAARAAIEGLKPGEILVLDNLRLCAEENMEDEPERLAKTIMIQRLAAYFDFYVNDAFSASHRSQPSLVAFPKLLPSCAGRLMERELKSIGRLLGAPERPCVYVIGGAKVEDKLPVIENILRRGLCDKVLVGGVAAKVFLKALGKRLSGKDEEQLKGMAEVLEKAKAIASSYRDRLAVPVDMAFEGPAGRVEGSPDGAPGEGPSLDIGGQTIERFLKILEGARTVMATGPMGVIEREEYSIGTKRILEAIALSGCHSVIGGGHLGGFAASLGIAEKFSHISTAGGAMLAMLSGKELPAVKALVEAAKAYRAKKGR